MNSLGRCGESCILTLLRVRVAWQVWGVVHAACVSRGRRGEWCDLLRGRASFCVAGAGNRAVRLHASLTPVTDPLR